MEDNFSFDEEIDEARDVKRKKLAYKEAVAEAKQQMLTYRAYAETFDTREVDGCQRRQANSGISK